MRNSYQLAMLASVVMAAVILAGLLPLPASAGTSSTESTVLAVIVSRNQVVRTPTITELSLIFWRKKLYWADGKRMQPVNLATDNSLRKEFSQLVLGSLPETQAEYWNGLYYDGTSPPHVVSSQEAMLRFVAETPGAIGYVDACKADARVKVILWLDDDGVVAPSGLPTSRRECVGQ